VTAGALFSFECVSVAAPQGWRLHEADGSVPRDGVTAIVGPSGSGKSTLLRLCNRLEIPDEGVVRLHGDDVATIDPLVLRRRVGMVFQRPTPFAGTGRENLRVADAAIADADAAALLERVRLDAAFLDRDALQLSGGEAQRLCLARSLAAQPDVLLMDEVTSSVDPATRVALEELARACAAEGTPVLWVTHDLAQARRVGDHVLVVIAGRIAHSAPKADLSRGAPPEVVRFFEEGSHAE
jgi:putative ABC transport system ATP-binding protein